MKINLEFPYSESWRFGYVVLNKESRRTLILYNSPRNRSSTQFARYLKAIELGRFLTEDETVDHIDGDVTNDDLSNLQILSLADNIRKSAKRTAIHGTLSMYRYCRCIMCRQAKSDYNKSAKLNNQKGFKCADSLV